MAYGKVGETRLKIKPKLATFKLFQLLGMSVKKTLSNA